MLYAKAKTGLAVGMGAAILVAAGCSVDVYTPAPQAVVVDEGPPPQPPPDQVVVEAPPAPYVEVVPDSPGPDFVWVGGYWGYSGGRYVWIRGRYIHGHGRHWHPGYWNRGPGGYVFVQGRWE
jgi:hypothetical protein